jgi:hypothetical protein
MITCIKLTSKMSRFAPKASRKRNASGFGTFGINTYAMGMGTKLLFSILMFFWKNHKIQFSKKQMVFR